MKVRALICLAFLALTTTLGVIGCGPGGEPPTAPSVGTGVPVAPTNAPAQAKEQMKVSAADA